MGQDHFGKFTSLGETFRTEHLTFRDGVTPAEIEFEPGEHAVFFNSWALDRRHMKIWMPKFLKNAIENEAEATNSSISTVIETALRDLYPDSWESDLEKRRHEHYFPSRRSTNKESGTAKPVDIKTELYSLEFNLPNKLIQYLEEKFSNGFETIYFECALMQALEQDFCKTDNPALWQTDDLES